MLTLLPFMITIDHFDYKGEIRITNFWILDFKIMTSGVNRWVQYLICINIFNELFNTIIY